MKNIFYILIAIVCFSSCGDIKDEYTYDKDLYKIDWQAAADSSTISLIDRYWNDKDNYFNYENDGLSLAWHYWPQAHAMDVVVDAYIRTNDKKYLVYFDKWYSGIKVKNGNTYYNNFYDDMEWIALTLIRMYEVTKEDKYLTTATDLWIDIRKGWNSEYAGGGVAWTKDQPWSKNACSNGPASIIASKMYAIKKDPSDLQWAKDIYHWEKEILLNPANGAVYDNVDGRSNTFGKFSLSYNQGTFVGAAYELYKSTGEKQYLNDARKSLMFGISDPSMIDQSNNLLRDEGNGDGGLFKGILIRYMVEVLLEPDLEFAYKNKFTTFFNNNADILWRQGVRKDDILFNTSWASAPAAASHLTTHTSGCMMMEMKALFERKKGN